MRRDLMIDLAECTEFRQTLQARPPRIVHGTAVLLVLLLTAALVWSAVTEANIVVRATGRVRPVSPPTKVFAAFGTKIDGRVVEVHYREGAAVHEGQTLIRLDTGSLDNDIARQRRTIETGEEELTRLADLRQLLEQQCQAAHAKAQAELDQAQADLNRARRQRDADIRVAELDRTTAEDHVARARKLFEQRAVSQSDLVKLEGELRQAAERLAKAQLPLDDAPVQVARRAMELVEREYAARKAELEMKSVAKQGEIAAAAKELANLELERRQSVLRAPLDGVVIAPEVKVGDVLERGRPVVEIASRDGFRFEIGVPSEDVGHLRHGLPVRIKFDAYDYQKYGTLDGSVCFISPDSRVPADKQQVPPLFVVEAELAGDEVGRGEHRGAIKLGMTGQAEIITDRESLLWILVRRIRRTISLG